MALEIIKQHYIVLFTAAFCLGLDKGGLKTLLVLCMYFLTKIIGPKYMLSVLAPIMFIGDLIPIAIYKSSIQKKPIVAFLPMMILGIFFGGMLGQYMNEKYFTIIIAVFILTMAIMMSVSEINSTKQRNNDKQLKPFNLPLRMILGFIGGISTISNSAAAITNLFFFRETKNKEEFIGTSSALFFIVNGIKLLIFIFIWKTITLDSILLSLFLIPGVLVGTFAATKAIKYMPEKIFKIIIIFSVYYVGIMLVVKNLF